jgi:hypothetical protein
VWKVVAGVILDVTEAADDDWIRRAIFPLLGRWRGVSGVFKGLLPRGFISSGRLWLCWLCLAQLRRLRSYRMT